MKAIKEITEEEAMCRYENAIFFHSGKVACLAGDLSSGYKITKTKTIDELLDNEPDGWTNIYFMHSDISNAYIAYAGETSYGGCGFIALRRSDSEIFQWLIHLNNCNNLISVSIESGNVIAVSDAPYPEGSKLIVPINHPEEFKVINTNKA